MNPITGLEKLCKDKLKYGISNIIRPSFDKGEYIRRRQLSYKNIYQLHSENMQISNKCENLYTVLYSKYFTQRFIIQEIKKIDFGIEDDETLKQIFKELLGREYASKTEFDNAYLQIIKNLRKDSHYKEFEEINEKMDSFNMSKDEQELFFVGSSNTDIFLEKKLNKDVDKLKTKNEKILDFLQKHRYINGWLTAIGIWFLGPISLTLEKIKKFF